MVYRGKPSRGCQTCRTRKIRCDQLPEGCNNCAKAGFSCPGYRDQLDLLFLDETEKVINSARDEASGISRKASTAAANAAAAAATATATSMMTTTTTSAAAAPTSVAPTPPPPPRPPPPVATEFAPVQTTSAAPERLSTSSSSASENTVMSEKTQPKQKPGTIIDSSPSSLDYFLLPSLDERATSFFRANYVLKPEGPLGDPSDAETDASLLASMKALGLAGYSAAIHAPDLMKEAMKHYLNAIRETSTALQTPAMAKKDSTLLAIIILSHFETMTGLDRWSIKAWANHVNGAAALIKLRGVDQFKTAQGRRMFMQVTSDLFAACLQNGLPTPDHIHELRREAAKYITDPHDLLWRFHGALLLYTDISSHLWRGTDDAQAVIQSARYIDRLITGIFADVPPEWKFETVYEKNVTNTITFDYHHIYRSYFHAQIWNCMRAVRIMLNDAMLYVLQRRSSDIWREDMDAQIELSQSTVQSLQMDILASVPQHLGYIPLPTQPKTDEGEPSPYKIPFLWTHFEKSFGDTSNQFSDLTGADLPPLRFSGGYSLAWSLYVAGNSINATDLQRTWILEILRLIASDMGFKQAAVLADIIEKGPVSPNPAPYDISLQDLPDLT